MNKELTETTKQIYKQCVLRITDFRREEEGIDYDACNFRINESIVRCRTAKITPKKVGQFVTFWKRNSDGIIEPFHESYGINFYVVNVQDKSRAGQFVFPQSVLISKGILSTDAKEGKRGFRVYPSWDQARSKQANSTQKWQIDFFYEINMETSLDRVKKLYEAH